MNLLRSARRSAVFEVVFTVVIALGLALSVQAFAVKPYKIPSGSMEPTLKIGERVLVNRLSHHLGATPHVGDIVVFMPTRGVRDDTCANSDQGRGTTTPCGRGIGEPIGQAFIKRVVAVGGDTIAIRDGQVIRNGQPANEPFAAPCEAGDDCDFPFAVRVPFGTVFVMGDNRGNSDDSRFWGPVPVGSVVGKAVASYWPLKRFGRL